MPPPPTLMYLSRALRCADFCASTPAFTARRGSVLVGTPEAQMWVRVLRAVHMRVRGGCSALRGGRRLAKEEPEGMSPMCSGGILTACRTREEKGERAGVRGRRVQETASGGMHPELRSATHEIRDGLGQRKERSVWDAPRARMIARTPSRDSGCASGGESRAMSQEEDSYNEGRAKSVEMGVRHTHSGSPRGAGGDRGGIEDGARSPLLGVTSGCETIMREERMSGGRREMAGDSERRLDRIHRGQEDDAPNAVQNVFETARENPAAQTGTEAGKGSVRGDGGRE
ncbi:hypothetical protein DFH09DRAFT_1081548 [Mycena vulgaris]|nr:hypothetical protein DFH09DRAFT_1081548 [Mycena vulgaris]